MGYRSWRQSKCRSSSSFPSPFSILERKGHKSLCEEEQAGLAVTQDLKEGGELFANRLCAPARESLTGVGVMISTLLMKKLRCWKVT